MNKKTARKDSFGEKLTSPETQSESAMKVSPSGKALGLSEEQLVQLSDDLRRPIKDPSSLTNPMQ